MENMTNRFIRYCKINTRSDENSDTIPSTPRQWDFIKMLAKELEELGFEGVKANPENCFVTAHISSNVENEVPTIGFISHVDTADYNSENVNPQFVYNYDGSDILLNSDLNMSLTVKDFPNLKNYVGKTLITTDGTTLLGADDKAGVVEIIHAIKYLIDNPSIPHGTIYVAFGPDEEIGRGADNFKLEDFPADFAYTMDGSSLGELEYESFNAAKGIVTISGVSVHPGTAKNVMINASKLAMEFDSILPADEVPEKTEGYEGFFLLADMKSNIERAEMQYLIRDHDRTLFDNRKDLFLATAKTINDKYNRNCVEVKITDQYYNMYEIIKDNMECVNVAASAMENLGILPDSHPIRGGTDGSKISFMGLPTPNIFTGCENFHGPYEFACVEVMETAKDVIIEIARLIGERS